jgi:hypothetical protein
VTTPFSTTTPPARFLLLGDSHAGPIGRAAQQAGIAFQGGPIGAGRDFTSDFFRPSADDVVFTKADSEQYYRGFLKELGASCLGRVNVPLVTTFGLCAHFLATAENWRIYRRRDGSYDPAFLTGRLFDAIVRVMVGDALAFYRHTTGLGLRTLAVLPPQRVPVFSDQRIFFAAQDTVRRAITDLGVEVVDTREQATRPDGLQRPELCETNDEIHGNLAFGRLILADLLARGL